MDWNVKPQLGGQAWYGIFGPNVKTENVLLGLGRGQILCTFGQNIITLCRVNQL